MAATARRTFAKVNSSAMRARHPEVPNLIPGLAANFVEAVAIARYCSVRRAGQPEDRGGQRQSVNAGDTRRKERNVPKNDKVIVLVTCGSAEDAGLIAEGLVEQRLAACVDRKSTRLNSSHSSISYAV